MTRGLAVASAVAGVAWKAVSVAAVAAVAVGFWSPDGAARSGEDSGRDPAAVVPGGGRVVLGMADGRLATEYALVDEAGKELAVLCRLRDGAVSLRFGRAVPARVS